MEGVVAAWRRWFGPPVRDAILAVIVTAILLVGSYGEGSPSSPSDRIQFGGHAAPQPGAALILFSRQGPLRLLHETPAPGLFTGTIFDGTYSEDLILNPWFLAAPVVLALAALVMLKTPYGLRLRGYSESPAFARHGPWQVARTRLWGALLGALWAAPAAGILLRSDTEFPTLGLGYIALACAVAGRWAFLPGIALALGPALLRTLRPYAADDLAAGIALQAAPFALALLYLIFLSRRALRAATTRQTRLDPDVL